MSKLTDTQRDLLRLVARSNDVGEGWRRCSPLIYKALMPHAEEKLIERNDEAMRVRLTDTAKTLLEWT